MSLSVQNNESINVIYEQLSKGPLLARYNDAPISDTFTPSTKITPANNGKFDISEAAKNFGKGIISPITSLFSSVFSFMVGISAIAATLGITIATKAYISPLFFAMGMSIGGYQMCSTVLKMLKAKNGDDTEKAFFNLGGAATSIGLSFLTAKPSLRATRLVNPEEIDQMNSVTAIFKNFRVLPESLKNSYKVVKDGIATKIMPSTAVDVAAAEEEAAMAAVGTTASAEAQTMFSVNRATEAAELLDQGSDAVALAERKRKELEKLRKKTAGIISTQYANMGNLLERRNVNNSSR